jgi:hypothetical protein
VPSSARIRLEIDPGTGKRTIVISYESDADALPHEHEEAHRALLEKLFEKGLAKAGDAIHVEREGEKNAPAATKEERPTPQGVKQGS